MAGGIVGLQSGPGQAVDSARAADLSGPELAERARLPDRRSVVIGDRFYSMSTADGLYPAAGWHIIGEMGGFWTPPVKLLDGVWFGVDGSWLGRQAAAESYTAGHGYTRIRYAAANGVGVVRTDTTPDGIRAGLIGLTLTSRTSRTVRLDLDVERGDMTGMEPRPALVATIVDVTAQRVIAQRRYAPGGEAVAVEPSPDGLVVLLQPTDRIGTVAVGRVDTRAGLRLIRLGRVTAGFQRAPDGGDVGSRQIVPGLAVDARSGRAYVVAAGSPVAEITLARLSVGYHSLTTPGRATAPSVLGMLRRALAPAVPAAEASRKAGRNGTRCGSAAAGWRCGVRTWTSAAKTAPLPADHDRPASRSSTPATGPYAPSTPQPAGLSAPRTGWSPRG